MATEPDAEVQAYVDAIEPTHRPLFDRFDRVVRAAVPGVEVVLSYKMPTYRLGRRRLYVGVWKHGLSIYGWGEGGDGGFVERHPELRAHRGTIKLAPADLDGIGDDELAALARAVLVA